MREDDDSEWRFSLEDLEEMETRRDDGGDDDVEDGERGDDDVEDGERGDDGVQSLSADVEAGSPSAENVLFVALGLALGLVIVWQLFP